VSYYPAFLDLTDLSVVVVGGGEVARGKIEGLLRSGARVKVVARRAVDGVRALGGLTTVELHLRDYEAADVAGARIVVAATDDRDVNRRVSEDATRAGALVNVVDDPELSSFIAPAVLERGELQVAVSTSGGSPAFAVFVRDEIAERIGPEYGVALTVLRRVREKLRATPGSSIAERKRILRVLAEAGLVDRVKAKDPAGVDELLRMIPGAVMTLETLGVELG